MDAPFGSLRCKWNFFDENNLPNGLLMFWSARIAKYYTVRAVLYTVQSICVYVVQEDPLWENLAELARGPQENDKAGERKLQPQPHDLLFHHAPPERKQNGTHEPECTHAIENKRPSIVCSRENLL